MKKFEFGFKSVEMPFVLKDRSYANDICSSFYFKVGSEYYILWIEHQDKTERENPEYPRYAVCKAINEGDEDNPEIYSDQSNADILQTEEPSLMLKFMQSLQC